MSSSRWGLSLRLVPLLSSSVHYPVKTLISRPVISFRRTIVTFQNISTRIIPLPSSPASYGDYSAEESLPAKLEEIVKQFQSVQEARVKYEQLVLYGKNLKPLDSEFKTKENKVEGCISQVWVRAFLDQERNVVYEADSDSALAKGLAAVLVQGLSGSPVQEILRVKPGFVLLLGLQQSLLFASRNNGFLNMLRLIQKKAQYHFKEDK